MPAVPWRSARNRANCSAIWRSCMPWRRSRMPPRAQAAIGYVAKAVDFGIDPETFKSDPAFSGLKKDPAFREAIASRGVVQKPLEALRVIDPSGEGHSP